MTERYEFAETAGDRKAVRRSNIWLVAVAATLIVGYVVARGLGWIP